MNKHGLEQGATQQRIAAQVKQVPPSVGEFAVGERAQLLETIATLRQHKHDYMDAAEQTRKALLSELAALKQPSAGVDESSALEAIRAEFPLFDDADLDQEKHHCEWSVQHDRKRLNALLDKLQARAQLAAPAGVASQASLIEALEEIWERSYDFPAAFALAARDLAAALSCAAPSPAPASDVVQVPRELLELIEQSWRVPNGLPKSVPEHAEAKIVGGLAQLRALLNGGRV
jgi:hypothetical protein